MIRMQQNDNTQNDNTLQSKRQQQTQRQQQTARTNTQGQQQQRKKQTNTQGQQQTARANTQGQQQTARATTQGRQQQKNKQATTQGRQQAPNLRIDYPFDKKEMMKNKTFLSSITILLNNIHNTGLQKENGFKLLLIDLNLQSDNIKKEAAKYINQNKQLELFLNLRKDNPELFLNNGVEIPVVIFFENEALGFYVNEKTKKVYPYVLGFGFLSQLLKAGGIS